MSNAYFRKLFGDEARGEDCPEALRRFLDDETASPGAGGPDAEIVSTSQGRIVTRVRGSHVDVTVKLARGGRMLTLAIAGLILALATVVGLNIYTAFATGRVKQILDRNAGAHCAAIGDPVAAAECLYEQKEYERYMPGAGDGQEKQPAAPVEQ